MKIQSVTINENNPGNYYQLPCEWRDEKTGATGRMSPDSLVFTIDGREIMYDRFQHWSDVNPKWNAKEKCEAVVEQILKTLEAA